MPTWAIHRIEDVTLTDKIIPFAIPERDPVSFGLPWHEPRPFSIRFTPGKAAQYVQERIWPDNQVIEKLEDGSIIITMTSQSEPEVLAWVRRFGPEAELLYEKS